MSDVKVLTVNDDPLILSMLGTYFKKAPHITVVDEASDGHEVFNITACGGVDIVLTNIRMPNMDGVEPLERIKKVENPLRFIAITSFDTDETMLKVLSLDGNGCILKTARLESVVSTIEDVFQGGTVVSPISATRLIKTPPSRNISSYKIAQAGREVLGLIYRGKSNHNIAKELGKSPDTIKKHPSSMFNKFGATSRLGLALKTIDTDFQPPTSATAK